MGFVSTVESGVASIFGVGNGSVDESGNTYTFNQQQKDFIKAQFLYGVKLKRALAAGTITQDYFDKNIWLTTQTLQAPYSGWWTEFKDAIESEDLQWLSKQIGESVSDLSVWLGQVAGSVVGGVVGGVSEGLATGLIGSLGFFGWLTVIGAGVGLYYAYKKGLLKKLLYVGPLF
jgi:hypothetical protein